MAAHSQQTINDNLQVPHPNYYRAQQNLQQPSQIRVPIPLNLIEENQPVEVVVNGNRLNGHIAQKIVLPQPMVHPKTKEICIGKINVQYTDQKGERKYYEMLSVRHDGTSHQCGEYHFHFIPNSAQDVAFAEFNNTRSLHNPLQFSPHSVCDMHIYLAFNSFTDNFILPHRQQPILIKELSINFNRC